MAVGDGMGEINNRNVKLIQLAILILNSIVVISMVVFIDITTEHIRLNYEARQFLGNVNAIPQNPKWNVCACVL